jgi:hypothetical protein
MPAKSGRHRVMLKANGSVPDFDKWDAATAAYIAEPQASSIGPLTFAAHYPQQWNVPVYTLWGSYSNTDAAATAIMPPLKYAGNLTQIFDPTNDADLATIRAAATVSNKIDGSLFWWGTDLVVKAEFDDGSSQYALVFASARGTDPLNSSSFTYWAVNLPEVAGAKLVKVSLYNRPMESRYSDNGNTTSSYYTATNLNSTLAKNVNGANYLSTGALVKTTTLAAPL